MVILFFRHLRFQTSTLQKLFLKRGNIIPFFGKKFVFKFSKNINLKPTYKVISTNNTNSITNRVPKKIFQLAD